MKPCQMLKVHFFFIKFRSCSENVCIFTGCEITEFPGFRDTQKHVRKPNFLTRVSDWTPCKNQSFRN